MVRIIAAAAVALVAVSAEPGRATDHATPERGLEIEELLRGQALRMDELQRRIEGGLETIIDAEEVMDELERAFDIVSTTVGTGSETIAELDALIEELERQTIEAGASGVPRVRVLAEQFFELAQQARAVRHEFVSASTRASGLRGELDELRELAVRSVRMDALEVDLERLRQRYLSLCKQT